jgi:6-phospho-beta-glucosidase
VAGICDTPMSMLRGVAQALGRRQEDLGFTFFGLNHLSWIAHAWHDGVDLLPHLLASDTRLGSLNEFPFDPELARLLSLIPNEYLYYYYYRERALANLLAAESTRGEEVQRLSRRLLEDLRAADPERHPERGLSVFHDYLFARRSTYMAAETGGAITREDASLRQELEEEGGEGYAGVALAVIGAVRSGDRHRLVLNVPNRGAVAGMRDDDVVECMCEVDEDGARPLPVGAVPEHALRLMQQVKLYERLTVDAVAQRSRSLAVAALMAHPLVGSYSLASALMDDYLQAHAPYVGNWQ